MSDLAQRNFKRQWALAVFAHPAKPQGAVAMAFKLYMEMDAAGEGIAVSDQEFIVSCGVSDGSCRVFKRWLVANGFVEIRVRGQRGRCSQFKAKIPAAAAAIRNEIPAAIAGNRDPEYRRPMPVLGDEIPATTAANRQIAAANAGIPTQPRAEVSNNIYNNTNNLTKLTHPHSEQDTAREGEEEVAKGVFVNCETVRHLDFTISIASIAMQLATTANCGVSFAEAKQLARDGAISHAIQWAAEIANGKRAGSVVPGNTANFIRGSLAAQLRKKTLAPNDTAKRAEAMRKMQAIVGDRQP